MNTLASWLLQPIAQGFPSLIEKRMFIVDAPFRTNLQLNNLKTRDVMMF